MFDRHMVSEAQEFGTIVRSALADAGGDDLVMQFEADGDTTRIRRVLDELGIWEIQPLGDHVQLEIAAAVCETIGTMALPYPVAERLAAAGRGDADAIAVLTAHRRVNCADRALRWLAVDGDGKLTRIIPGDVCPAGTLGPCVVDCEVGEAVGSAPELVPLVLVLSSFTLLGMLKRTNELTLSHIQSREQFGSQLVSFQSVQHQYSDALVAVQALDELSRYALWSLGRRRPGAVVDAVTLRSEAVHGAEVVFRVAHQLHGAIGFCDESFLSWLSRYSQALRRLPGNGPDTEAWLLSLMERDGFDGLFSAPREPAQLQVASEQVAALPERSA